MISTISSGHKNSAQPVVLWGFSQRDFSFFFDYFVRINLDPRALVVPADADVAMLMPVLALEQLDAEGLGDVPVVLAPGLGYAGFETCRAQLAALQGSVNSHRLVHACSGLNELAYDLTGRVHTVGFPGMGNVLLQSMIYRLMEQMPNPYPGIMQTPQLGILTPDHQSIWADLIRSRLQLLARDAVVYLPQAEDTVSLRVNCDDGRYVDLYGIPNPHWHTARLLTSHVLPSVDFSRRWIARGGKLAVQMRNPLDTIVSCAAKLIRPPSLILEDLIWFRRIARLLAGYLQQVQELPAEKIVLHYEDIIDSPLTFGLRIAHALEANSDVARLGQIWADIGLKELVGQQAFNRTQSHCFRPGAGKWREYLDVRHASIAAEEGLPGQMAAFGYAFDHGEFRPVSGSASQVLPSDEIALMQAGDWPYFLFDAPVFFNSNSVIQGVLPSTGMKYVTNDNDFANALCVLDADSLPSYYASGSPLISSAAYS